MTTLVFDTLQYAKRAQEAGFTREQAEFQAEEIANFVEAKLSTKDDIDALKKSIQDDINLLKKDIEMITYKLTIRLSSIIVVALGALTAIIKIWH